MLEIALWTISLFLILVSALPRARSSRWWVRVWDYPRLQLAVALGAAATVQLLLAPVSIAEFALLIGTLAALARHIIRIFPYTKLHTIQALGPSRTPPHECTVGLLVANVLQSNRNSGGLIKSIEQHQPDIAIIVETDHWWDAQLSVLAAQYPYGARHPLENTYGMILLSRYPLDDLRVFDRVALGIPSITAQVRLPSGDSFDLYAVHPEPPQPSNDTDQRDAELLLVAKEVSSKDRPGIVAGDLNDVAWSHTTRLFQRISGLLDPRIGRGLFATFHAEYRLARWPLDHVFHSKDFRLIEMAVLPYFGSDHFPIFVRLSFEPSGAPQQENSDRVSKEDHTEANEKILEGKQAQ